MIIQWNGGDGDGWKGFWLSMVVVECCGELLKWNGEEKQVISGMVDGDGIAGL